jgi:hypothetical protein
MSKLEVDQKHFNKEMKKQHKRLSVLSGIEVDRAQAAALNKTARKLNTVTIKDGAKKLKIKSSLIRYSSVNKKTKRITLHRATAKKHNALLHVNAGKIQLGSLGPKKQKRGVKVAGELYTDSFIATPTNSPKGSTKGRGNLPSGLVGKQQVFFRKSKSRYGLKARYKWIKETLSGIMNDKAGSLMINEVPRLLKHEYDYRINRELNKIK